MAEDLSLIIERLKAGSRDDADIQAIAAAIASGKLVLTNAPGSVGVGGDVSSSQFVTGYGNVTGDR